MYPVTNAVKTLLETEQPQLLRVTGTDRNNTAISITDADVMYGGFSIDRYSCNSQKLEIGTAVAAELTLKLNNTGGTFDSLRFEGSELYVEVGVVTGPSTTYWIPCGYFIVDEQTRKLNTITIKALDRMMMLDFELPVLCPWTDNNGNYITDNNGNVLFFNSGVAFPNTVQGIINQICIMSGLTLGTNISSFPNASYSISSAPAVPAGTTLRDYIQWAAALMGTCAYIDWQGKLCFGWYASASYTSTASNRFDSDLYENDITITGVTYTDEANNQYIAGTKGYTIDLTRNYLIGSNISTVLSAINTAINGFTYRPFSAVSMPAPYLWPMDVITFVDKDNVSHNCAVTNVNLTINDSTKLKGRGETEKTNSYARPSSMTAEQALALQRSVTQLDNTLTQQEIFDRLTDGGQTQGISLEEALTPALGASTPKRIFLNVDYVNDGEMAFNHLRGGTLTLGGIDNIDGKQEILDADGNVVGEFGVDGIHIYAGGIQLSRDDGGEVTTVYLNMLNDLFRMTYAGQSIDAQTSMDGYGITATDNNNNTEVGMNPNEIKLSKNNTVVFYVNGDRAEMSMYGDIYCQTFNCAAGVSGTFTANGHTLTITNGIITNIT